MSRHVISQNASNRKRKVANTSGNSQNSSSPIKLKEPDYKILFESLPGLYLILLPDFTITAVSDAYLNATMTVRKEITGKGLFEIFPDNPEDPKADGVSNLRASLNFVLKNKTAHSMAVQKYDIRKPDGRFEERFWSPLNKPVLNKENEVDYIIHRVEDVTEFVRLKNSHAKNEKITDDLYHKVEEMEMEIYKRAKEIQKINEQLERKVTERTETLKQQFKEISDYKFALDESCIVAITDNKGIIQYANDNFCHISKYSREELIGKNHRIVNSGYHPKEFFQNLWATISQGKIWRGELRNKAKDGTIYWVDTTIVPFLDDQNKPYQYVAIRSDATKRKTAEQELYDINTRLEQRVADRTEQLEAVNKELESFTYSVSHDLRSPLRAVNGYAQMLYEDYGKHLDNEAERIIGNIMNSAKKMGQLIDDLLLFSRVGRKELIKSNINMRELVISIYNEASDGQSQLHLEELLPAFADSITIRQVWTNLISNAVKYSKLKANPLIEIGSKTEGDETVYYIKDNGAGFDMRYADKLFGVFQRLHSEDEFEGTGVGLAIVHRIITKHGGNVWAEGESDKGAIFYFTLPNKI